MGNQQDINDRKVKTLRRSVNNISKTLEANLKELETLRKKDRVYEL
jgi:hypothetical protein